MSRAKRKDANHAACTAAVRAVGAVAIDCTKDTSIGWDEIWCWRGQVWFIELKNPNQPPSKRRLTPNEQQRHAELAAVDVTVHIVETEEEALKLIGATE